jgi:hypothetical protein
MRRPREFVISRNFVNGFAKRGICMIPRFGLVGNTQRSLKQYACALTALTQKRVINIDAFLRC